MFGTLGPQELFVIFVVGLVVFGPRKLPEIGKSLGRMMAEFKRASADFQRTIEDEVQTEKLRSDTVTADYVSAEKPVLALREAEGSIPASIRTAGGADLSGDESSGGETKSSEP